MSDLQITAELTNGTIYNINMSLAMRDSDTYNTGLGRKGFDCSNPINDGLILANIMSAGKSNQISNITFNFLNGYDYNYAPLIFNYTDIRPNGNGVTITLSGLLNPLFSWFGDYFNVNNINIEGTNFHNVQDAYRMFFNCHRIKNIPNNINLKNATNIGDMFYGCDNIGTIPNIFGDNISIITTSNTHIIGGMGLFHGCSNLTTVPNINLSKVEDFEGMFGHCWNLINIPNFNTSNAKKIASMFDCCYNLINIPSFDLSNCTNAQNAFSMCESLINIPNLDLSNCTDAFDMFEGCCNLASVSNLNISENCQTGAMFDSCYNLRYINTRFPHAKYRIFTDCYNLESVQWSKENLSCESNAFTNCYSLSSNTFNNIDNIYIEGGSFLFKDCSNLTDLPLCNFIGPDADGNGTFANCYNLINLNIIFDNTINYVNIATYEPLMFENCNSLSNQSLENIARGLPPFNKIRISSAPEPM